MGPGPSARPRSLPRTAGGQGHTAEGTQSFKPQALVYDSVPMEILPISVFMFSAHAGILQHPVLRSRRYSGSFCGRALLRVRLQTEVAGVKG